MTGAMSQHQGNYGGHITVNVLELAPTREMDGYTVECQAFNAMSVTNVSSDVSLDLRCKYTVGLN